MSRDDLISRLPTSAAADIARNTHTAGTIGGKNGFDAGEATRFVGALRREGSYGKAELLLGVDQALSAGLITQKEAGVLRAAIDANQQLRT